MKRTYHILTELAEGMIIDDLCQLAAYLLSVPNDEVDKYDCTKLTISQDIQDCLIKTYQELMDDEDWAQRKEKILSQGPALNTDLPNGTIEIGDGFIDNPIPYQIVVEIQDGVVESVKTNAPTDQLFSLVINDAYGEEEHCIAIQAIAESDGFHEISEIPYPMEEEW